MFSNRKIILTIILLCVISLGAYVVFVYVPSEMGKRAYRAAKAIGEDFNKAFGFTPEITINKTVILGQQTPVMELATLSQTFQHQYEWKNTWMKSTKTITIKGSFEAKAGFDLNRKFSVTVTDNNKAIIVMPEPELLSVESQGDIQYRDEQGIWNWVSPADRTEATNAFFTDARRYAEQASFIQDSKRSMEEKLVEIVKNHAKDVEIRYDSGKIVNE